MDWPEGGAWFSNPGRVGPFSVHYNPFRPGGVPSNRIIVLENLRPLGDGISRFALGKTEGQELLAAWSKLMSRSIPGAQLRADSPSLPANQEDAANDSGPPAKAGAVIQLKATE